MAGFAILLHIGGTTVKIAFFDQDGQILGGGVSKAGAPLLEGAMRYYQKYAFHACREVKLVPARLGNDAGAYGAYKLILDAQAM